MSSKSNEIKIENNSAEIFGRKRKVSGGISMTEGSFMESVFGDAVESKENNSSYQKRDSDSEESKDDPSYDPFVDVETESEKDDLETQSEYEMMFDMETDSDRPNASNIVPIQDPKNRGLLKSSNSDLSK